MTKMTSKNRLVLITVVVIIVVLGIAKLISDQVFNVLIFLLVAFAVLYPVYLIFKSKHYLRRKKGYKHGILKEGSADNQVGCGTFF